jgi:hypothetical protein
VELGVGLSDFGTLEVLRVLPVGEIARLMGLAPRSASVALDRPEKPAIDPTWGGCQQPARAASFT